jgi:hypothetical protein
MEDSARSMLNKINELRMRGEDGEATAAVAFLERKLAKYGMTLEQFLQDEKNRAVKEFRFIFKDKYERQLLIQIVAAITGNSPKGYESRNSLYVKMTETEAAETKDWFAHYRKELQDEIEFLLSAFWNKHNLFRPRQDSDNVKRLSPEEMKRLESMMRAMKSKSYVGKSRQIEQKNDFEWL